jgi:hypothetical protein
MENAMEKKNLQKIIDLCDRAKLNSESNLISKTHSNLDQIRSLALEELKNVDRFLYDHQN